jgi:hypothetical protein
MTYGACLALHRGQEGGNQPVLAAPGLDLGPQGGGEGSLLRHRQGLVQDVAERQRRAHRPGPHRGRDRENRFGAARV